MYHNHVAKRTNGVQLDEKALFIDSKRWNILRLQTIVVIQSFMPISSFKVRVEFR
jgi:hypothetical protein